MENDVSKLSRAKRGPTGPSGTYIRMDVKDVKVGKF